MRFHNLYTYARGVLFGVLLGFGVVAIANPVEQQLPQDSPTLRLAQWLEGIRVTGGMGSAAVKTSASAAGTSRPIASGSSRFRSLSVGTGGLKPGLSYGIAPFLVAQSIDIADFYDDTRQLAPEGARNVPYIETDFETGAPVDPKDPNIYAIHLQSAGAVGQIAYNVPLRCAAGQVCVLVQAETNVALAEWQRVDVQLGNSRQSSSGIKAGQSVGAKLEAGLTGGGHLLALLAGVEYRYFPKILLPDSLEFRDRAQYNEQNQAFERRRVFVSDVTMTVTTATLSLVYQF